MRTILLAAFFLTSLSGCSSYLLHEAMDKGRSSYHDSIQVRTAPGFRVMLCPREGSQNIYRIETSPRPLFLDLDDAVLRDSAIPEHISYSRIRSINTLEEQGSDSIPSIDTLELVLGSTSQGFIPSTPGAPRPRALLVLAPSERKRNMDLGEKEGIAVSDGEILLLHRDKGGMRMREVEIRAANYEKERQSAHKLRLAPLYLLTVPLDIVTSPVQLGIAIIVAPFAYVIASGLGGHPW